TELFARLAPGATLESARTELNTIESALVKEFSESYPTKGAYRLEARLLRDQIVSRARTVLLVLLAASALIFIIACSNVANLILARSVQREGELALRAALGATRGALRRTLLAESLLLGGTGAILGVLIALWTVPVLGQYAARFSVRALELSVDPSLLWVGVSLAMVAAVLLAFVPRLPSADTAGGLGPSGGSVRITSSTGRRLRVFAVTQIGASFVLLAGASMLLTALIALQRAPTAFDTGQVLAVNVPVMRGGNRTPAETRAFYQDVLRKVRQLGGEKGDPIRIVGVVADIDDENIIPEAAMTMYQPSFGGRLFVRTQAKDPYTLVPSIARIIRQRSPDQPVERAATLEDVKADLLAPDRLNTIVFGAFALVALTIAIVGVAGVLAFSVSTRMKEFGIRLAVGSEPGQLLASVLREGAAVAGIGIVAGAVSGVILERIGSAMFGVVRMPGALPVAGAAILLVTAAILASWMPAARASRVDILQALRSD